MHDNRSICGLLYVTEDGSNMASVLVEQNRTYVKIVGEGTAGRPLEVSDVVLWPAMEDPDLQRHLHSDDWMTDPPIFTELFEKYRACEYSLSQGTFQDGAWSWKNDGGDRWAVTYAGNGYPLPDHTPSDDLVEMHRSYVRAFDSPGHRRFYGPDLGKQDFPRVFGRGLDDTHCIAWDTPESSAVRPQRREIIILQGEGDLVTVLLCGYAKVGQGDYFEMFVPIAEMIAADLGDTDVLILRKIKGYVTRHGADCAKWIVKNASGDWMIRVVVDKVKPGLFPDHSPSPVELPLTMRVVREFLDWRTVAYQQEVRLLGRNADGLTMSGFEPVRKSRH
jgi:hypothetical protein